MQQVAYDFGTLSLFLLIGYFLRKKIKLLQNLYLPASVIGGIVGLLLSQQVLGKFSPVFFDLKATGISSWAGVLTAIVFSVSFLGTKPKAFGETAYTSGLQCGFIHQGQVVVGLLCAGLCIFFLGYNDLPLGFGLTPVFGWYGGHGTALSAGTIFVEHGWEAGIDVSNTMATIGLVCGVIFGVIMINIGAKKGKTRYIKEAKQLSDAEKSGYIAPEARKPIGMGVTHNDAIDPFAFALCWSGLICAGAKIIRTGLIAAWSTLSNIPWFAVCLMLSMLVGFIFRKTGFDKYIDRPSMSRIAGLTMDYLVCAALSTLNLSTVATYLVPLLITNAAILLFTYFVAPWFAKKISSRDAFERGVGNYGQSCGVVATGLMLTRICDPEGKSTAGDFIVTGSTIGYIWMIPYFTIGPVVSFTWSFGLQIGIAAGLMLLFFILARLTHWQKSPAWERQKPIWECAPGEDPMH